MTWVNPLAWFGLAAVAVPIVVHLLAHSRAQRMPFPTLRFIQPTRLAAIRRRALDDIVLLAVRSAIVLFAVAAFAGPLLLTSSRRGEWNARRVRAIVVAPPSPQSAGDSAFANLRQCAAPECVSAQTFESRALSDGIRRAVAWLESAPPAQREVVIAAPLTLGSVTFSDLAMVPKDVGIRFERTGEPPAARTAQAAALFTATGTLRRTVTLDGAATSVREFADSPSVRWPIEIVAPPDLRRTADAALAAVLSVRARVPPEDRRVRLTLVEGADGGAASGEPIRLPWMADAAAHIARDAALLDEAARVPNGLADARLAQSPWQVLARAGDGRPLASAAASQGTLVLTMTSRAGDLAIPTMLRAIAGSLAPDEDPAAAEILPIPESQLNAWSRAPGPAPRPRPENVERDDRRWLWGSVLVLLGIEVWLRRSRRDAAETIEETRARVA